MLPGGVPRGSYTNFDLDQGYEAFTLNHIKKQRRHTTHLKKMPIPSRPSSHRFGGTTWRRLVPTPPKNMQPNSDRLAIARRPRCHLVKSHPYGYLKPTRSRQPKKRPRCSSSCQHTHPATGRGRPYPPLEPIPHPYRSSVRLSRSYVILI